VTSIRVPILILVVATSEIVSGPAFGTAIANSTLGFSHLTATSTTAAVTLDDVWLLQGFASANNSLGAIDAQFNFDFSPATTSASAAVTWASASGSATATGDPANLDVSGNATSAINIPGCSLFADAFSEGHGTLSNSFTISGSGSVGVSFGVDITGALNLSTDQCGLGARTQTIFTLAVDGNPILFDFRPLAIGRNTTQATNFSTHLADTVFLEAGISHFLILQADSESEGHVPEPASALLVMAALGSLLAMRTVRL